MEIMAGASRMYRKKIVYYGRVRTTIPKMYYFFNHNISLEIDICPMREYYYGARGVHSIITSNSKSTGR